MSDISTVVINRNSQLIDQVIELGDKYRKFLGLFTRDAYLERAERKSILAAVMGTTVAGYLLFYKARNGRIRITHMCVDEPFRKNGIARLLFGELLARNKEFHTVILSCRNDFESISFWPQLGFVYVSTRPGRGDTPTKLTNYRFTRKGTPFFDEDIIDEERDDVVIDANIFFDLESPSRNGATESCGLLADWISPIIRLCVTEELQNELRRSGDPDSVLARRLSAHHILESDSERFLKIIPEISEILPDANGPQELADRRQLARTIASAAVAFVTRDEQLLKCADEIYRRFGLRVVRPSQLIGSLDEVRNESEYQRDRLIGTAIKVSKKTSESELIARIFFDQSCEQKEGELRRRVDEWFSAPDRYTLNVITDTNTYDGTDTYLACFCCENSSAAGTKVVFLRTQRRRFLQRRFGTIQRCVLMAILCHARRNGSWHIEVNVDSGPSELIGRLTELGFHKDGGSYWKLCPPIVGNPTELLKRTIDHCGPDVEKVASRLLSPLPDLTQANAVPDLEKLLWPAKVVGSGIQTFIVAIRPRWAKHLLGTGVNDDDLFGTDMELAFNLEGVYYRSARQPGPTDRSRVVWYVKDDPKFDWSGRLIACSHVECVELGTAKVLFKKNERFGVYRFQDVLRTVKGDHSKELMAIRFSNTERLVSPMSYEQAKSLLSDHVPWNNFQSPLEIPEEDFLKIYRFPA